MNCGKSYKRGFGGQEKHDGEIYLVSALGLDSEGTSQVAFALPLNRSDFTIGVIFTTHLKPAAFENLDEKTYETLSHLGAQFLSSSGIGSPASPDRMKEANPDELTPRQLRVLAFQREGLTNAGIAKEVMLSESAIRQENVKIYGALDIKSREEASKKARALGIIPKAVITD